MGTVIWRAALLVGLGMTTVVGGSRTTGAQTRGTPGRGAPARVKANEGKAKRPATGARGRYHYVSPKGTPSGDGTRNRPWDLQTALKPAASIHPGDTVWLWKGTYKGVFTSKLTGTEDAPVVVRAWPGERVTIDGGLDPAIRKEHPTLRVEGRHTWFWGIEVTDSYPVRVVNQAGPRGPRCTAVGNYGVGTKLINMVIHDGGCGVGEWSTATIPSNTEIHGCLVFNNGFLGSDRGHGHAIYGQNQTGTKTISSNVIFGGFGYGVHIYGSKAAYLNNFRVEDNDFFMVGSLSPKGTAPAILLGGSRKAENPVLSGNTVYAEGPESVGIQLGYIAGCTGAKVEGNYVTARTTVASVLCDYVSLRGNTWNGGVVQVKSPDVTRGNTHHPYGKQTKDDLVFVRPNRYETGRANVTVFNGSGKETVAVDIGPAGLVTGQPFEVRDSQNFFGPPVLQGVYEGKPLALPMTATEVIRPEGNVPKIPPHTGKEYGSFIVVPVVEPA